MASRIGVVLSGCGFLDGTEIHEAVLSLFFLDRAGAEIRCFAPDRDQLHVINHLTGEPADEVRNVLVESARIARGEVRDLAEARIEDLEGLVLPGGYGAAKNLSDVAVKGADAGVDPHLTRLVAEAVRARKPVVAICISPVVLAAALKHAGRTGATVTIGNDAETAATIESMGSRHQECPVDGVVVDEENRIITTPAYMLGPGPADVGAGIERSINQLISWLT